MVCRGLMLELHRAGYFRLPAKKRRVNNPFVNRTKTAKVTIDHSPIDGKLSDIKPLRFCQVRRTGLEKLFNSLIEHYQLYRLLSSGWRTA
jgi:predicted RNA-binding protein